MPTQDEYPPSLFDPLLPGGIPSKPDGSKTPAPVPLCPILRNGVLHAGSGASARWWNRMQRPSLPAGRRVRSIPYLAPTAASCGGTPGGATLRASCPFPRRADGSRRSLPVGHRPGCDERLSLTFTANRVVANAPIKNRYCIPGR